MISAFSSYSVNVQIKYPYLIYLFGCGFAYRVFHTTSVNAKETFLRRAALRMLNYLGLVMAFIRRVYKFGRV
jgi:phosphotransferase system  glucose/maltose/N-acetylglucosamine-specific IIC component